MPNVHNEDEAVAVGFLPNLVLKGVVEDEDFTFLPFPETQRMKRNERLQRLCPGKHKKITTECSAAHRNMGISFIQSGTEVMSSWWLQFQIHSLYGQNKLLVSTLKNSSFCTNPSNILLRFFGQKCLNNCFTSKRKITEKRRGEKRK